MITASQLRERMQQADGVWPLRRWALFDVREVGESQQGHIWSATFLPRQMIEFRLAELVSAPAAPIVLYDSGKDGDRRAERALRTLSALGYRNAERLEGGLAAWVAAGYDLATGWNVPSKLFGEEVAHSGEVTQLGVDELASRMQAGDKLRVIDVRTGGEYRNGTLPDSVSAPSFDWTLHAFDLVEGGDEVILHCAGRTRSIIGAATARVLGLPQVRALENGTMGWILSERDLATGQDRRLGPPSANSRATASQRARQAAEAQGVRFLSAADLAALIATRAQKPLYVFDVRDAQTREQGHIASAVWLPGGQACQRTDDFVPVPGAPIVFVDDADSRAALTAYWFRRMGFADVSVLEGGVPAWRSAGYALDAGGGRSLPLGLAAAEAATRAIGGPELSEALRAAKPPLIIDVGTSAQFTAGHVAGAKWLSRGSLEERIGNHAAQDTPIVVAAWYSAQAAFAAASLAAFGFRDVAWLALDGPRWKQQLPLESGWPQGSEPPLDALAIPYLQNKDRMREYLDWEQKLDRSSIGASPKPAP